MQNMGCEVIPLKPFAMESCAHFSRSSLPSFASITRCSPMHKLKLLRLSDMNEPNPAILGVSGSEHDKKWFEAWNTPGSVCFAKAGY
jgi:hypothetical protein